MEVSDKYYIILQIFPHRILLYFLFAPFFSFNENNQLIKTCVNHIYFFWKTK